MEKINNNLNYLSKIRSNAIYEENKKEVVTQEFTKKIKEVSKRRKQQ